MKLKFIPIAVLGAVLFGCGGGGGGSSGNPSAPAQVNTPFVLTAKLNGVAVGDFAVNAGEGKVLGMLTGEEVELTASSPAILLSSNYGKAAADIRSNTSTVYRAMLNSTEHTTANLVFAMASDPSKVARVTLTVRGTNPSFDPVTPVVRDALTYAESGKRLDGAPVTFPDITHIVTAVNANGSWNEDFVDPENRITSKVNFSRSGNRLGYQATTADPTSCKDARFDPEELLLVFPLTVGTPYRSDWITLCQPADRQSESLTASVLAYEKVTTRGGVFNALRINQITTVTNSTDTRLPGRGYAQNVTVWFDPILGRNVKYSAVRTYPGGEPAEKARFLSESTIELINTIKN